MAAIEGRSGLPPDSEVTKSDPQPSRLLARFYSDAGLAAVANALEIPAGDLDVELAEAIRRGARYLFLMPKIRLPNIGAPAR
jgi:hypothetical protein